MEREKEEIEKLTQEIIKKIENNPRDCISIFESTLLGENEKSLTSQEYLAQLQKTLKISTCQGSWNHDQLLINCLDCQNFKNSCICVNCFLKGNHQGHRVFLSHSNAASCDCGNPLFWSPKGFCKDHPGQEPHPEMTQLDEQTRIKLISISKAAFSKYIVLSSTNPAIFYSVTSFLSNLVSIGDATRRCVSLGMEGLFSLFDLFQNCAKLRESAIDKLIDFFGLMMNDPVFRSIFSISFLNDLPKFLNLNHSHAINSYEYLNSYMKLYGFTFHAATIPVVKKLIKESAIDWNKIFKESINILMDCSFKKMDDDYLKKIGFVDSFDRIMTIINAALFVVDKNDPKIIELVDDFASVLVKHEFSYSFSRIFGDKYDDQRQTQLPLFRIAFYLFQSVYKISKHNINTTKPLQLIAEFFKKNNFQSMDFFQKIDGDFNRDVLNYSVLSSKAKMSQAFFLHLLAFGCLNLKEEKLVDYVSEVTDNVELFLRNWAAIPLRWISASNLCSFQFYVRNSEDQYLALLSFKRMQNNKYRFISSFALLQTLLKSTKDVDSFLMMIIATHGFFDVEMNMKKRISDQFDDNQQRLILLIVFHFVLCLIFDTLCVEKNYFTMRKLCVISNLMKGDLNVDGISSLWYGNPLSDDKFLEDLLCYASKIKTKNGTRFHLKDSSEWHPLLPFMKVPDIIPLIQKFVNDNPDSLINFPNLPSDTQHLLFSPVLWSLEYFILRKKCCKDYRIIHQLVFNTLIITSQNCEQYYQGKEATDEEEIDIQVQDFAEMVNKMKKFTFNQFLNAKISFVNSSNVRKSMIELIENFGKIGFTVLTRMNITTEKSGSSPISDEVIKKNHERAKMIKLQIMSNFNQKQKTFQSTSESQESSTENCNDQETQNMECGVCHLDNEKDCFVYPALIYKSPLSSYINWRFRDAKLVNENDENKSSDSKLFTDVPESFETFNNVHICLHPIHSKCIQRTHFNCPTDRCQRNASIPIIDGLFDDDSKLNSNILLQTQNFVKKAYFSDLKFAVYSLASQIEILEIRHRSNPDCLDNPTVQPTLRNIYLCIWHVLRNDSQKVLSTEESNQGEFEFYKDENNKRAQRKRIHLSPLMKYILLSLQFNEAEIEKTKINMENFLSDKSLNEDINTDYKMLQFLRCAAIFDHFARCNKITEKDGKKVKEFIDWDEILGSFYLCKHYNVPHAFKKSSENDQDDEMTLPMFSLIDLPKNYLDFIHQPYSAPILESSEDVSFICLLTGKQTTINKYGIDNLYEYINNEFNGSFSIFLELNGYSASKVLVVDSEFRYSLKFYSLYTDKFGDEDIGIKRGSLLELNESSQEEIINKFLSGLWTNSISKK